MIILGIESSCDDTALAIYTQDQGCVAHVIHSQVALHGLYGGVVPELASRDHLSKMAPLYRQCMAKAQLKPGDISAVAYTAGPGLIGALLVGSVFARSLAWAWNIPSIAVHHLEAHLLAPMLETEAPDFPFVALLVSGGHTMLIEVRNFGDYHLLGETLDDAAGEAFDKTAKCLGLPYPGGPALAALAMNGVPGRFQLPRPMLNRPGMEFSFSGLKTAVMLQWRKSDQSEQTKADIAYAFEDAVTETLAVKAQRALKATKCKNLVIAGGVGANKRLRARLQELMNREGGKLYYPRPEYCTDNAAMVAYCGFRHWQAGHKDTGPLQVRPRWDLFNS